MRFDTWAISSIIGFACIGVLFLSDSLWPMFEELLGLIF